MVAFQILLVLAAVSGLLAAVFWVRVAASHSLDLAGRLDGTERRTHRSNRRALSGALIVSGLAVLLAAGAFLAGSNAGVL
jgi:hypothetical protein